MGVVYAAHQSSIARTVAVKMLKPSAKLRTDQRDKFISEAVVTGELDHPNIVPIYDLGSNDEGALFYSMKRVRGTPWDKVINQKQLDENLSILLRVADAVAFAHAGGVIHRDLKPENVMLVPEGADGEVRAVVMDFGLAKERRAGPEVVKLTQTGIVLGTPEFMSPEQIRGRPLDGRSDVYAIGVLSFELFTGTLPFSGKNAQEMMVARLRGLPRRLRELRPDLSARLDSVVNRALALAPDDRYQSMEALARAFEDCLEGGVLARILTSMRRRP
jgi:hypothetical protein